LEGQEIAARGLSFRKKCPTSSTWWAFDLHSILRPAPRQAAPAETPQRTVCRGRSSQSVLRVPRVRRG